MSETTATTTKPRGPRAPKWWQSLQYTRAPISHWEKLHERYGDFGTVRFSAYGEVVWVSSPSDIEQILLQDSSLIHAGEAVRFLEPILGRRSMLVLDEDEHLQKRRALLPRFHGDALKRLRGVVEETVERAISRWPLGERFELLPHMKALSLEVILRTVFGLDDDQELSEVRGRIAALVDSFHLVIWGGWRRRAFAGHGGWAQFERRKREADAAIMQMIAARRRDPRLRERVDVLSRLLSADSPAPAPSDIDIRDDLMTLLIAGHETTSVALTWAIELLARHPDVVERLRTDGQAGADDSYLQAVIKECLRLRPIVPFTGRTLTQPFTLRGHRLASGTKLWIPILLVHVLPRLYPEPHAFRPERFLEGAPEPYTWLPFGGGTRRCIGAGLANLEMKVVLRSVVSRLELVHESGPLEPERANGVTLVPRYGGRVMVRSRADAHSGQRRTAVLLTAGSSNDERQGP